MIPCHRCARHVRVDDVACPFCGVVRHGTVLATTFVVLVMSACGSKVDDTGGETSATTVGTTDPMTTTTTTSATTTASTTAPGTTEPGTTMMPGSDDGSSSSMGVNDDSDDGACAFYGCACCDFGVPPVIECDLFAQDCPVGEKCMPWANDGGVDWNATRCSPVDANPGAPGDACTVEGSAVSGIDDCERATMCWNVDAKTLTGTCAAMCLGSEAAPVCKDPANTCIIAYGGAITLCLPTCDPDQPMCEPGEQCVALRKSFVCAPV